MQKQSVDKLINHLPFSQATFLNPLIKHQTPVHIYLINGIKLQGKITAVDAMVIVLTNDENDQLIYKHAISTVLPQIAITESVTTEE